jgi:hypothetical protein
VQVASLPMAPPLFLCSDLILGDLRYRTAQ